MKIAWFCHRYAPCSGGSENFVRFLAERMAGAGHSVDVITTDAEDLAYFVHPSRGRLDAPADEVIAGVRVHRCKVRHAPLQRWIGKALSFMPVWSVQCRYASYMPIIPEVSRTQGLGRFDAVFAVGFPYTVLAYEALRLARRCDAPLFLVPFLHLAVPGDPVHKAYTRPHQVRLLREADGVISPTPFEQRALAAWGIPRDRMLLLPPGVEIEKVTGGDPERFRTRHAIAADEFVIGQLGALDLNKGTNDLVAAVASLNADPRRRRPFRLILAGSATPRFEAFRDAQPSSVRASIALAGKLKPADIPHFYACLDAYAMPSRTDSFGIVFLEAWANAKPVVAAAAGGVVDVVEHNATGLLVPFGDVPAIAGSIALLEANPQLANRLGAAGKALVESGWSWDDRAKTLIDWLETRVKANRYQPHLRSVAQQVRHAHDQ